MNAASGAPTQPSWASLDSGAHVRRSYQPSGIPAKPLKPYVSFWYSWDSARREAGLGGVRIHDLRHSYASFLVNAGRTLYEVQRLLGHTQIKTTQRYAHLSQDTLLAAANAATKAVGGVMLPMAQVVALVA